MFRSFAAALTLFAAAVAPAQDVHSSITIHAFSTCPVYTYHYEIRNDDKSPVDSVVVYFDQGMGNLDLTTIETPKGWKFDVLGAGAIRFSAISASDVLPRGGRLAGFSVSTKCGAKVEGVQRKSAWLSARRLNAGKVKYDGSPLLGAPMVAVGGTKWDLWVSNPNGGRHEALVFAGMPALKPIDLPFGRLCIDPVQMVAFDPVWVWDTGIGRMELDVPPGLDVEITMQALDLRDMKLTNPIQVKVK